MSETQEQNVQNFSPGNGYGATPNHPITTPLQVKFWSSLHKCNRMKCLAAFSLDKQNFDELCKRYGFKRAWKKRGWAAFGHFVDTPSMIGIPFSELDTSYWDCMPNIDDLPIVFGPTIVTQTEMQNRMVGEDFDIGITATGDGTLTYEWTKIGSGVIPGQITNTIKFTNFQESQAGKYSVKVSNGTRSINISHYPILIKVKTGRPTISLQPIDQTQREGNVVTFTSTGIGYKVVQWQSLDTNQEWIDIAGAVHPTYSFTVALGSPKVYRVSYSQIGYNPAYSDSAKLIINDLILQSGTQLEADTEMSQFG